MATTPDARDLYQRLQFEALVAELSARFVNLASDHVRLPPVGGRTQPTTVRPTTVAPCSLTIGASAESIP